MGSFPFLTHTKCCELCSQHLHQTGSTLLPCLVGEYPTSMPVKWILMCWKCWWRLRWLGRCCIVTHPALVSLSLFVSLYPCISGRLWLVSKPHLTKLLPIILSWEWSFPDLPELSLWSSVMWLSPKFPTYRQRVVILLFHSWCAPSPWLFPVYLPQLVWWQGLSYI